MNVFLNIETIACKNGTFGISCKHECSGNCLNNETCDKKHGDCSNCAHGWENKLCNKSKKKC